MFAKEYGWAEEVTLNLPFRRLWQYANRILEDGDPKFRETYPAAARIRNRWLQEQNGLCRN
jgi:hypothetical protein